MWTGDSSIRCLLALSILLLHACTPEDESTIDLDEPQVAWWYDIEFQSESKAIHGIDVTAIDDRWSFAHVLEPHDLQGRVSQIAVDQFLASSLSFSLSSDLDGDGVSEEFYVGVYQASDERAGRFVLITKNGDPVQHFSETGSAGFSALLQGEGEVRWYKCMECGEFESIKWAGESYVLE